MGVAAKQALWRHFLCRRLPQLRFTYMLRKVQNTRQKKDSSFEGGVYFHSNVSLKKQNVLLLWLLLQKFIFSRKGQNKRTFEVSGCDPREKDWKVLMETEKINSTNCGFRKRKHSVVTYETTRKGWLCLYPKRRAAADGTPTFALKLFLFTHCVCSFCIMTLHLALLINYFT